MRAMIIKGEEESENSTIIEEGKSELFIWESDMLMHDEAKACGKQQPTPRAGTAVHHYRCPIEARGSSNATSADHRCPH